MSEDENTPGSFRDSFEDEEEDQKLFETPPSVPTAHPMQNLFAGENVDDGSHEPSSSLFHRMLDLRNSTWNDMRAAGEQEVVRSPEKVKQSSDYLLLQPTLNENELSNANNFLSGSFIWNKKMRSFENIANEDSCQPLDLSIRGASWKSAVMSDSENSSCKKIQSDIFAGSPECSRSALNFSNNLKKQENRHVCGVCQKACSSSSNLSRHKHVHS
ncbi:hypothetical protein CDAR_568991 [Caerostris darwini]|uniref:C2H2-type domain-containing protein n=1 Tax=Caerostris darwini TaxID=1538125 RepID=A0AAV4Q8F1_9ARAC|nr:hypothetical protein CDAR_568991 [Caerostris darwini]